MAEHGVVVPFLQKKCLLFGKAPLLLDKTTSVRTIKSEHLGAILSKRASYTSAVNPKIKCLVFQSGAAPQTHDDIYDRALCAVFAMNVFSGGGYVSCAKAFFFRVVRTYSITDVAELPFSSDGQIQDFNFDTSAQPASVSALYAGSVAAVQKDPSLRISL